VSMRIVDLANQQRGPACLAGDALVSYLYDECTFEERQRIEGHLASCGMCSAEVEALGATRVQISSWAPPDVALGFRISATTTAAADAAADTPVLPARMPWWRQPMPAWGQMVAATVIFGLGMAAGSRQLAGGAATNTTASTVSADQLANLESRLRREMAAIRSTNVTPAAPAAAPAAAARLDDAEHEALMRQVRQLVRESEDRQQQVFTLRAAQVARDAEIQRRVDVANMRQSLEQMQGSTSEVQRQQAELYRILSTTAGLRR